MTVFFIFDMEKTCKRCNQLKELNEFPKSKSCKDGHLNFCKKCKLAFNRKYEEKFDRKLYKSLWNINNQFKRYSKRYGISLIDYKSIYENLRKNQKELCAICKKNLIGLKKEVHLDHSHVNGKIRGILCRDCNVGLGFFKDDTSKLENAIEYLKLHK